MSSVKTRLVVEAYVECPKCSHEFDLVNDTELNDAGLLLRELLPDETWIDAHKNFKCSVTCTECGVLFNVEGVDW